MHNVGLCVYQLIISENLVTTLTYISPNSRLLGNRHVQIIFGAFTVLLPLSLAKDLSFLGKIALLSVGGNALIVLVVLLEGGKQIRAASIPEPFESFRLFSGKLVQAIGVISFCKLSRFGCPFYSFQVSLSVCLPS